MHLKKWTEDHCLYDNELCAVASEYIIKGKKKKTIFINYVGLQEVCIETYCIPGRLYLKESLNPSFSGI